MSTTLQTGSVLDGKYRLLRRIGEGGMGTVFEGENLRIKRKVAIKVLHEHVATSPEFAQRFVREARASARIGSTHVCDVLDLGDLENGEKYIVMELLEGESLEDHLERVPKLTGIELAPIAFEMLEGLGAMHQVGVVHRDLKPANVFLCKSKGGTVSVKILDFGVAKIEASEEDPSGVHDMTTTGTMMGTPLYMSPEQARGARDVDGRTDLYAASVIFYRALTGRVPHEGTSLHELLFKIVLDEPKAIRDLAPEVDEDLARIITRGLERDPEKRYTSARLYQEEIAAWSKLHGLDFKVTLPSEPPPLRKMTGGFPAAQIELVGPALRSGNTPVSVRGDAPPIVAVPDAALLGAADTQASVMPPEPPTMQSPAASTMPEAGASPVKAVSNAPLAPLPISSFSQPAKAGGDTLLAGSKTPAPAIKATPEIAAAPKAKEAPKPKPKAAPLPATKPSMRHAAAAAATEAPGSSKTMYIVGAVVVIAAAILGVKLGGASRPTEPIAPDAAPSSTPPVPATPDAAAPIVPTDQGKVVPAVSPDAAPTPNNGSAPMPGPVIAPRPSAAPSPKPSAPPEVSGRAIRTDPGF